MTSTPGNEEQLSSNCSVNVPKASTNISMKTQSSGKLNRAFLARDYSFESSAISRCSSIESMLELRKPDPEEVLIGLGFGPPPNSDIASRIPQRFLQPSKLLSHIDVNKFLDHYGEVPGLERRFRSWPNSPARPPPTSS